MFGQFNERYYFMTLVLIYIYIFTEICKNCLKASPVEE